VNLDSFRDENLVCVTLKIWLGLSLFEFQEGSKEGTRLGKGFKRLHHAHWYLILWVRFGNRTVKQDVGDRPFSTSFCTSEASRSQPK
jgi:hypothetical protein